MHTSTRHYFYYTYCSKAWTIKNDVLYSFWTLSVTFKYVGYLLTNQNSIQEEIKCRLKALNSCYYSVQTLLSSRLLSKNLKIKIYKTIILPVLLYGCEAWSLTLREESRLRVFEAHIWAQEGWEWGVEEAPQWGTS